MLEEWRRWAELIATAAKEIISSDVKVYVIGSVAEGNYVASSDVDILIISSEVPEKLSERSRIRVLIEERLKMPYYHPFEFHIVRPEEAEPYLKRAKKVIRIL